jgi:hydrogenase maturation protein HypF
MLAKNLNSPHTSACGRCFDAFAAALGICLDGISYEGQAAIGLENLATPVFPQTAGMGYPYTSFIHNGLCRLSWKPFWSGILTDLQHKADLALIAAKIHHGLAQAIADNAWHLADSIGTSTVVLSGGVFQNRLLLQEVSRQLRLNGKTPLTPSQLPCNDGGLAFGQAVIALAAAS